MGFNDALIGLVLVIFAIAEIAYSTTFPSLHGQAYGPSLFPIIIGCGLMACGLVLIARGLRSRSHQSRLAQSTQVESNESTDSPNSPTWIQLGDWAHDPASRINMLLVPVLLVAYIVLSEPIGFIPLSVAMLTILLFRLGSSPLSSIVIAFVTTVVLQLLFAKVLLVPLPSGLLLRWLG